MGRINREYKLIIMAKTANIRSISVYCISISTYLVQNAYPVVLGLVIYNKRLTVFLYRIDFFIVFLP